MSAVFADVVADSTIEKVTVYRERALVTRAARVMLSEGSNTIRFENLPEQTDPASLQAKGIGDAMLAEVQYKREHFVAIPDEQRQAMYARLDELRGHRADLDDLMKRLRKSIGLLDQIGRKVTFTAEREAELELDPAKWDQMLGLYAERGAEYDHQLRQSEREKKKLNEQIEKLEADIREAGFSAERSKSVAELTLVADRAGAVRIELTYLVHGPSWTPTYDLRVDTSKRQMSVSYYGNIRQSTGEDWTGVQLSLSTANPGLGGQHPELVPWRIDERQPLELRKAPKQLKNFAPLPGKMRNQMEMAVGANEPLMLADAPQEDKALGVRTAEVTSASRAVVFDVKGASSIDADNDSHRVAIAQDTFPVAFRYSTVPKLSPYAYLKAKAVSPLSYPLLPGRSNVFLDGDFVAASQLDLVAPKEEFWVFLGADEGVKIEHKLVRRYRSSEGLAGRRTRYSFEYEIQLQNTHSVAEEVVVWDQLPISGSDNIVVKLVRPKLSKNSPEVKVDEDQFVEWHLVLQPHHKRTIPFAFYVETSADVTIDGLDAALFK